MLILNRKLNQRIIVGDDVAFMVVDIRGASVRVGIDAPDGVGIDREEIYLEKRRNLIRLGDPSSCLTCQAPMDLFQPDPRRPSRILGVCMECGEWAGLTDPGDGRYLRNPIPGTPRA